jgi:hypothetical protein
MTWRALFCRHEWKLLDKEVLPSFIEQAHATEMAITKAWGPNRDLCSKAVVLTLSCEKCGKLVIRKESNP